MIKQPYSCWLRFPGNAGWDRKGSPESNLHVYGEDSIKMAVYNMEKCIEEKIRTSKPGVLEENLEKLRTNLVFKEELIVILVRIHL